MCPGRNLLSRGNVEEESALKGCGIRSAQTPSIHPHVEVVVGSSDSDIDPFQLFGLTHDATMEQIRRRYRQLAFAYHPDRHADNHEQQTRKFMLVCEAYESILRMREAAERNRTYGPCGGCGAVRALTPRLDGKLVCPLCLLRPPGTRLLPPPPIAFLKCYTPIVCLLASAVLLVVHIRSGEIIHGLIACATALLGFVVVAVLGWLYPVKASERRPSSRPFDRRSGRREGISQLTRWL